MWRNERPLLKILLLSDLWTVDCLSRGVIFVASVHGDTTSLALIGPIEVSFHLVILESAEFVRSLSQPLAMLPKHLSEALLPAWCTTILSIYIAVIEDSRTGYAHFPGTKGVIAYGFPYAYIVPLKVK